MLNHKPSAQKAQTEAETINVWTDGAEGRSIAFDAILIIACFSESSFVDAIHSTTASTSCLTQLGSWVNARCSATSGAYAYSDGVSSTKNGYFGCATGFDRCRRHGRPSLHLCTALYTTPTTSEVRR